jgi:hypothetical protein
MNCIRAADVVAMPPHLAACELLDLEQPSRSDEKRQFAENIRLALTGLVKSSTELANQLLGDVQVVNVFDDDGIQVQEIYLDRL